MQFGLNEKTILAIHNVLNNYSAIQKAIIYGSRAKGNYKIGSDIDIKATQYFGIKPIYHCSIIKLSADISSGS
jgi:predicted nucleotidyltransferase